MPDIILTPVKPCVKCGACERNAKGACKACAKVLHAAWYVANKEQENAKNAAWRAANPERKKAMDSARYAENPEKERAYRAAYYAANSERAKARASAYQAANPEKIRAAKAARHAENPEKERARGAAYRAANPEAIRIHSQNRRARERAAGGILSKGLLAKLFKLQKGKCPCCKHPLGDEYHMDHIKPLALGGTNTDDNIQLLRPICNLQKNAKHPIDFMQQRGFLL